VSACDLIPDEHDVVREYATAREAASVYGALRESAPGTCRAQDYSKLVLAGVQMNAGPDAGMWQIEALDALRDLERAFEAARAVVLTWEEGEGMWRVWWQVRVEQVSLRKVPDVARSTADRITRSVDRAVQDALDARELRRLTVSEGRSAELNSPAPQVRTCMILYGDETFRDAKSKEVVK
jgi:hypothetical protein